MKMEAEPALSRQLALNL